MNIIITGASRGIGRAVALEMSKDSKNRILAISRSGDLLETLAESSENSNIVPLEGDINKLSKEPVKLLKSVKSWSEGVDILINNAGDLIPLPFTDMDDEDDARIITTNFLAPMRLIRLLLPLMNPAGHILNISSMSGFQGSAKYPGLAVYGAAKAALASLTESLAKEYNGSGPSFNALSLGAVQTEMLAKAFPGFRARLKPHEIAEYISYFALNGHKWFNGTNLPVTLSNP